MHIAIIISNMYNIIFNIHNYRVRQGGCSSTQNTYPAYAPGGGGYRNRFMKYGFLKRLAGHIKNCCMFEQKIKETTVQIYGILHSEDRHIKANKSPVQYAIYLHSQKA